MSQIVIGHNDHSYIPCVLFLQRIPFAVVGSNTVLEVGGKKIRGRKYPWGIVEGMTDSLFFKSHFINYYMTKASFV